MTKPKSRFIVFEGLDGAGTTTQAALLHDYLTRSGLDSFQTFEPTDGPVGSLIRELLAHRQATESVPETTMALLFAADRIWHSRHIARELEAPRHVVCDRYIFSSMAYQSLDPAVPGERVIEINRGCAQPDLTLFIDVPVETCLERISARNESRTIYEKSDLLDTISRNYAQLLPLYKKHFGATVHIDGTAPIDDVHERVVKAITSLLQ
ncbi:MAG: dTMP kinase [Candidatus Krumholzibacteriota bacterium]|nr:dTMP kinase [Candidatus Krumholzibacteriota bacterium]